MAFKYQLAIMGPGPATYRRKLINAIKAAVRKLDLNAADLEVVRTAAAVGKRNSIVGVWLGRRNASATASDLALLGLLLGAGVTVIPVVDSLDRFHDKVPPDLRKINGVKREPRINVVQAVLRCLGLTRLQRQAFITYKRSDSAGVAIQVFNGLAERGFHAFLDTASIEIGEEFQSVLWDRVSDADVHLFLDTPNALKSSWVCQELARVNSLGLGVVQVVWPGHTPTPGTEFSSLSRRQLVDADFVDGDTGVYGRLRENVWKDDKHIRVVFDGLGMRPERQSHLVWLNDSLQLKTTTLEALPDWWEELDGEDE